MKDPIGIVDLLEHYGFDSTAKCKLVRHQDRQYDVAELRR